jgi:hypothetical protein
MSLASWKRYAELLRMVERLWELLIGNNMKGSGHDLF